MVSIIYSDKFLLHQTIDGHPEKPERLQAVVKALHQQADILPVDWIEPKCRYDLGRYLEYCHSSKYIQQVEEMAKTGGGNFYEDTFVSPYSFDVATLAVSAWMDGIDQTLKTGYPCFALVRPPGHHALRNIGMGFCLFANAAIAAHYALEQPGVTRVAILDWDVHHGNGTQELVENNSQIAFCSIHQAPFFPFTGREDERGAYNNVLNIRVKQGDSIKEYKPIFEERVVPFLSSFQPNLLIVSAGYDANEADSLGWVRLQPEDYEVFTKLCLRITQKIVFGLEGGYELNSLSQSIVHTIKACVQTCKGEKV